LLSRFAPLSIDMQQAVVADQAVLRGKDKFDYVDNEEQPKSTLELARETMQHNEEVVDTETVDTETGEVSAVEPEVKLSDKLKEKLNIDTDKVISGKATKGGNKKNDVPVTLFENEK
jgi:recombinational DNA repair protein RecT